mgnify:CR=1 FL=1
MTKIEKVQNDIITYLPDYIIYDETLGPVVLTDKNVVLDEVDPSTYTGKITINLVLDRAVSYTHLRAHETVLDLVCRLLLEKKKKQSNKNFLFLVIQPYLNSHTLTSNNYTPPS